MENKEDNKEVMKSFKGRKRKHFATIPRTRIYDGKWYVLKNSFVNSQNATRLKERYRSLGYMVRIYQKGGTLHSIGRYHIYIRRAR